jgi:hypothetical protein
MLSAFVAFLVLARVPVDLLTGIVLMRSRCEQRAGVGYDHRGELQGYHSNSSACSEVDYIQPPVRQYCRSELAKYGWWGSIGP